MEEVQRDQLNVVGFTPVKLSLGKGIFEEGYEAPYIFFREVPIPYWYSLNFSFCNANILGKARNVLMPYWYSLNGICFH